MAAFFSPQRIVFLVGTVAGMLILAGAVFYYLPPSGIVSPVDGYRISDENIADLIRAGHSPLRPAPGFIISVFARNLSGVRALALAPDGTLLSSVPAQGKVIALPDKNADGVADEIVTVAQDLRQPHGLTLRCPTPAICTLFVAEVDKLSTFRYEVNTYTASPLGKIADLPVSRGEDFKGLLLYSRPTGEELLISVPAACDNCREKNAQRAAVLAVPSDGGTSPRVFASGLRRVLFMAEHPVTGAVWVTENSREKGDDASPDEINILAAEQTYGWPECYGKNVPAQAYAKCPADAVPSTFDVPAQAMPMGLAFVQTDNNNVTAGWPAEYKYNLLVAYHGALSGRYPDGYRIVRYQLDARGAYGGEEDFVSGWLDEKTGTLFGRPTDLLATADGALYVSDDTAGVIYRVVRQSAPSRMADKTAAEKEIKKKADLIQVETPAVYQAVRSPLTVKGRASGSWFFEGSFPVRLLDAAGKELATGVAQALGDWMSRGFVAFQARLQFNSGGATLGTLVLEKDNPSGLPEYADELHLPVQFRPREYFAADNTCVITGCSGQICAAEQIVTTCEARPEYRCFATAVCERQADGDCGWTPTNRLVSCLLDAQTKN